MVDSTSTSTLSSNRVLITGGTGFAGSHLVESLLAQGWQDVHVTSFSGKNAYLASLLPADHIHTVDLNDLAATQKILTFLRPSQIYHLAAYASVSSSFGRASQVLENNLKLQLNLLETVRDQLPNARVMVVGSGMEYDLIGYRNTHMINELHPLGPVSPYAMSKVMQDLLGLSYAYSYHLDIVRVRPFNHIGERQTTDFAIPSFAQQIVAIERGQQHELRIGNLGAVRDFTDVKDVCAAYLLVMAKGQTREVYNIGSGKGYRMSEVLQQMCQLARVQVPIVSDPAKVRPLDVPSIIADSNKIRTLGWMPKISLAETLQRIMNEWRQKESL